MRIALFTDTFLPDVNGVSKTLGRWTRFLESKGVECKVFAPTSMTEGDPDPFRVERFYSIPFLLYPECRLAIPNPLYIRKSLHAFQPTIIHCATPFNLGLFGLYYARKHGIPLVASYHTHFDQYLSHYKIPWVEPTLWKYMQWFHQSCRKVYVPSESTLHHLEAKGLRNLEIWSRGVDAGRFHPEVERHEVLSSRGVEASKFVLLYVGRLAPEKSVEIALETFAALPVTIRSNCHLIIAGDGPSAASLREGYGDQEGVTFTGFVEGKALADLYAAADLFIFPSATETFGNVVLESMAAGTAVIGVASGGVMDTIEDEVTGLLCPPGDVSAFVVAVRRLYESLETRLTLAKAGRAYALQQSWDQIFNKLYESYQEASNPLLPNDLHGASSRMVR
ncbi:glycosyltransferase family 1 protein [Paenibacillus sp. SYP-B3998]|uniref:Glycosyltransferase family 1 protein n=1 Tax=Paenibacillus sp. SYP-B3998 TaxID=2678564 RepID=A0A6G4A0N2_9BACL|nr:glycosyltransferase family 1 protein [Paenibacillus sp. SYP-B3998]NEW07207.1 glycosyltransferase family 1 protein [Paenibacillus sp. SYP-B3998]